MSRSNFKKRRMFVTLVLMTSVFVAPLPVLGQTSVSGNLSGIFSQLQSIAQLIQSLFARVPGGSQLAQVAPTSGLVGYWNFDEGSGTTASDSSGNGNTGALINTPLWSSGRIGGALNLDGVDDYVSIPNNTVLNPQTVTLSAWVNVRSNTIVHRVIDRDNGGTITYFLAVGSNGKVSFRAGSSVVSGNTTLSINTWHHISGTYNGNTLTIYTNGVVDGSLSASPVLTDNGVGPNIGRRPGGGGQVNGFVDDVRIYNRSLSLSEIQSLYAFGGGVPVADTTPPSVTNPTPGGQLIFGTTQTNLGVATNEPATCRYGTTPNVVYASIASVMTGGGSQSHTATVSGLAAGSSYFYYVRCQDTAGNVTTNDTTISFSVASTPTVDTQAPTTPANLSATPVSTSQINLSWTASTDNVGVTGYRVYRNGIQLATAPSNSYQDLGLTAATTYSYTVQATDAAGNNSAQSGSVSATTQAVVVTPTSTPPGAITPNTWVKLNTGSAVMRYYGASFNQCTPTQQISLSHPVGRAFSGVAYGNGYLFNFGGGHGSHPGNDVELFDVRTNRWTQQYAPECLPACCGGNGVPNTCVAGSLEAGACNVLNGADPITASPTGKPWTTHTFQKQVYDPDRDIFMMYDDAGLYSYKVSTKAWTRLVGGTLPGADVSNKSLAYDPDVDPDGDGNGSVLLFLGSSVRKVYSFNYTTGAWVQEVNYPSDYPGNWSEIYTAYDSVRKLHLVYFPSAGYWFYNARAKTWSTKLTVPSEVARNGASLAYDPQSQQFLIAVPNTTIGKFELWTLDSAGVWANVGPAGGIKPPFYKFELSYAQLWYDLIYQQFYFVLTRGGGAGGTGGIGSGDVETWAFKLSPSAPSPGTVQLGASATTVSEGATAAISTINRYGGSQGAVSVSYSTTNGTALAGSDYTTQAGTVTFADGDVTAKQVTIPILNDTTIETTETFSLSLSSPTGGATLGNPSTLTVTINDNDTIADTTSPTTSLTAPTAGATLSGTVTVSANASDNVGVVGVQFLLNGANLGVEDTTSPYSISWNTAQSANGSHALSARARDAAGNSALSTPVSVTVSNVVTPPSKFQTGNRVYVSVGPLSVRSTASLSGTVLGTQAVNAVGTVIGGPTVADGFTWWNVDYDSGVDGWGVEQNLEIYVPPIGACAGTIRQVGPTRTFTKISQAAAVVQSNDCVYIDAATYENEYALARWPASAQNITLRGVGGRPKLIITNGDLTTSLGSDSWKGIWVVNGNNTTVDTIEFACATSRLNNPFCSGVAVGDDNDAGIRLQAAGLTVRNSYFHDNDNGILGGPITSSPVGTVLIENTEFFRNGWGDGQSHNLYLNRNNDKLIFRNNYSRGAIVGHQLKSRAGTNEILYNRFMDESNGVINDCTDPGTCGSSVPIELPCGGLTYVIGNVIQKGSNADSGDVVKYAAELGSSACSTSAPTTYELYVVNNTLVNERATGANFIRGFGSAPLLWAKNNIFLGLGTTINWPAGGARVTTNNVTVSPSLLNQSAYDYRLTANSTAVIDQGVDPGSDARGYNLTPTQQYVYDKQSMTRPVNGALDVGAFEYTPGTNATPFTPLSWPIPPAPRYIPPTSLPNACPAGQLEAVYPIAVSADDGTVRRSGTTYANLGSPIVETSYYADYIDYVNRKNQGSSPYVTQLALWRWNTAVRPDGSAWPQGTQILGGYLRPYWAGAGGGPRSMILDWHPWASSAGLSTADWTNGSVNSTDPLFAASIVRPTASGRQTVALSTIQSNVNLSGYTGLRLTFTDNTPPAVNEDNLAPLVPRDAQTYAGDRSTQLVLCYTVNGGSDSTPPIVSLSAPSSSVPYATPSTVIITATASDPESGISKVEFYDGAVLASTDTVAPYQYSWNISAAQNGTHLWTAKAFNGVTPTPMSTVSGPLSLTVSITSSTPTTDTVPPTISLTAPAAGATLFGSATVSATASDNIGIAGVQFAIDGANLGAEDTTAPYSVSWDTAQTVNGSHSVTATARDAAGNRTTANAVTITVSNVAGPAKFQINDRVYVSSGPLNVRSTPSTSGTSLALLQNNEQGTVTGGPTVANGFTWWNVNWDSGVSGWSAEDFMEKLTTTTSTIPLPDTIPPTISGIISSGTTSSITISWTTNEPATTQIDYGLTTTYGQSSPFISSLTTSHSVTLQNLSDGTTYNIRLRSADAANNLSFSTNQLAATLINVIPDTLPPSQTTDLRVTTTTQTSAVLAWTAPGDDLLLGQALSYDLRYTQGSFSYNSATQVTGEPTPQMAGQAETYTLVGLIPNTTYSVALTSRDDANNLSPVSSLVSFTTLSLPVTPSSTTTSTPQVDTTPPGSPSNLITQGADRQVSLSWVNPTDPDFVRTMVVRKQGSIPTSRTDGISIYDGTGTSTTDTNLVNGVTYFYALYSYDQNANYSSPATGQATTVAGQTTVSGNTGASGNTGGIPGQPFIPPPLVPLTPTTPTVPQSPTITRQALTGPFSPGMVNTQVTLLQQYLIDDGSYTGTPTGIYDQATIQAVQRFQTKQNLVTSGTPNTTGYGLAGPATRLKLNQLYGKTPQTTTPIRTRAQLEALLHDLQARLLQLLMLLVEKLRSGG
ncbi:MAG: Ig-like domain-containing protein [Patescibacteria group bacterium]